jgi:hypothetical protein
LAILGPLEWHRFANGDFTDPVRVCRLQASLVRKLGAHSDLVQIHPSYAPKLVFKHGLQPEHLRLMPIAAEFGTVLQDRQKTLSVFYDDRSIFGRLFHMALKTTGEQHEIWITTFHRIDNCDFNRRLRKSELIRAQE